MACLHTSLLLSKWAVIAIISLMLNSLVKAQKVAVAFEDLLGLLVQNAVLVQVDSLLKLVLRL